MVCLWALIMKAAENESYIEERNFMLLFSQLIVVAIVSCAYCHYLYLN